MTKPSPLGEEPIERDPPRHSLVSRIRDFVFRPDSLGVTVDELSVGMGVSKKTFYRFFPTREAILRSVINLQFRDITRHLDGILAEDKKFPEKMRGMFAYIVKKMGSLPVSFALEVRKREPALYRELLDRRRELLHHYFSRLLAEGRSCGALRPDLNEALAARILVTTLNEIVQPHVLQELDMGFGEAFSAIAKIILEGLQNHAHPTKRLTRIGKTSLGKKKSGPPKRPSPPKKILTPHGF